MPTCAVNRMIYKKKIERLLPFKPPNQNKVGGRKKLSTDSIIWNQTMSDPEASDTDPEPNHVWPWT